MSKTLVYCTPQRLSCTCATNATVILCLADAALLAPKLCVDNTDMPYAFTTIEAAVTKGYRSNTSCSTSCGTGIWTYVFTYDETLLADPTVALKASDVTGVFCEGCLTTWVSEQIGNEPSMVSNDDGTITWTSPHGCTLSFAPSVACFADSSSVTLALDESGCIFGEVVISPDEGNLLSEHGNGLYLANPFEQLISTSDVIAGNNSGNGFKILNNAGNAYLPVLYGGTDDNTYVDTATGKDLYFRTGGTNQFHITAAAGDLIYHGAASAQNRILANNNTSRLAIGGGSSTSSANGAVITIYGTNYGAGAGNIDMSTANVATGTFTFNLNHASASYTYSLVGVTKLTILSGGQLKTIAGNETTGGGTATIGAANCPAVTPGAVNTWILFTKSDGSQLYIPAWK